MPVTTSCSPTTELRPLIIAPALAVDHALRAGMKQQRPCCIWFTGLSGAGKSTLGNQLDQALQAKGMHSYLLDGDRLRQGLCQDLGMTDADRHENIRRIVEVAKLMVDAGLIVIVSAISPFRADRDAGRKGFAEGEFIEVHVSTPLAECVRRPRHSCQGHGAGRHLHPKQHRDIGEQSGAFQTGGCRDGAFFQLRRHPRYPG